MATFPKPEILPNAHDQHISLIAQMQHYFEREGVVKAMQTKLDITVDSSRFDAFAGVFDELKTAGKLQPLHLDMVRGNVLFDKNKNVTGIIDFEKAAVGHFQLDLARTLAFLHVDCLYKDEAEVTATFLSKGYLRRKLELLGIPHRNISFTSDSLSQLVDYFALYDFYKFLLHNPYESLEQNQHYLRTRDKLLRSGVIGQATKQD